MKPLKRAFCYLILTFCFRNVIWCQTQPNIENGFKPYGSYDSANLDSINLQSGNLILHIPMPFTYPQRGGKFAQRAVLTVSSKGWSVATYNPPTGNSSQYWSHGFGPAAHVVQVGTGVGLASTLDMSLHRYYQMESDATTVTYSTAGYYLTTWDGGTHQLNAPSNSSFDGTATPTSLDAIDNSGYHVDLTNADPTTGVSASGIITDRQGNRYQIGSYFTACGKPSATGSFIASASSGPLKSDPFDPFEDQIPGTHFGEGFGAFPIMDSGTVPDQAPPLGTTGSTTFITCQQAAKISSITDVNGNVINTFWSTAPSDTMGRQPNGLSTGTATSDFNGCVSPAANIPISSATISNYQALDGSAGQMQVKICYANIPISTNFSQASVTQYQNENSAMNGGVTSEPLVVTVVLSDAPNWTGTRWAFKYDSYLNVTDVSLPTGGSIHYDWTEIAIPSCASQTQVSRAIQYRTVYDNRGNSYQWKYNWGPASGGILVNTVSDPLGNDAEHTFTAQDGIGGCAFYETKSREFQGPVTAGRLLKQVDTTYQPPTYFSGLGGNGGVGNILPVSIKTSVYPSGKVNLITRQYDTGPGFAAPSFGNVTQEIVYDWGQGSPGAALRETDTTYQWQAHSPYLAAHLLDLPVSVVIKDGSGNRVAETDYSYDETALQPHTGTLPTGTLVAAPNAVRGNLTTVSKWLNTTNSPVSSHTTWYDTGEPYQQADPLNHQTTFTYDPAYAGAYVTQTCSPQTGSVSHCVSGTYDYSSGLLTSFTNENATTQADGTTPGDSAHTSNYSYDLMFRLTSALAPPDPTNGNLRAQNSFNFSAPNVFPITVQRTTSITATLNDAATSIHDGLGRGYQAQHTLPNGTATVDTTFDSGGRVATVSNPYFTTSDPTYGITTNQYDGLTRVTQTTKQDGSISKVQYSVLPAIPVSGDCTITTDEAGKQRGACTDVLGRLVEVDEPNPAGVTIQANYHATLDNTGNFLLANSGNTSLWSTGTSGSNASSIFMQDDGNLVLYIFKWSAGTYATPTPGSYPQAACSIGTYLVAGQTLPSGSCIASPHWQYFLYMAPDGNLYIYNWATGSGTWGPGTQGHPGAYATLQTDGNFVVYSSTGVALWSSGTSGTNAERLDMEDDGRIILYKSAWNSGTSTGQFNYTALAHPSCDVGIGTGTTGTLGSGQCFVSPNGHFELLLQTDGNLVINDLGATPANALWSTSTGISPADPGYALRTLYTYDTLGNLTCVEQHGDSPAGPHGDGTSGTGCSASPTSDATSTWRVRRFTYDSLSRLLTTRNPESGTISYSYDNDGNLLQKTSPAPNQTGSATQTISYCYDELHRITGKAYGALSCPLTSTVVSYVYDSGTNAKGHLVSMTDQAGTATYSFDILGRMTTETQTLTGANNGAISKTLSYEYNLGGSLSKLHYPSGAVVTYTLDSAGRALSAVDGGSGINYVTGATYDATSALTGFVNGSGGAGPVTNLFSYNNRLQPCRMTASTGTLPTNCLDTTNHGNVFDIGYDFHKGNGSAGSGIDNGNVFGITNYKDQTRNQFFTYDPLNRLTAAWNAGTDCTVTVLGGLKKFWGNNYSYDAWGNLTGKSLILASQSRPAACAGEPLSVSAGLTNQLGSGYLYDAAGNMTHDATSGLNYGFDQENRLTGASGYTYTYDGDGNRVRKSNGNLGGNGTLYWYMTPGIVAETDLAGTTKSEYIFFDGERVARRDGVNGAGGVFYYFADRLKTASVITDATGTIKAESDYYPWGGELQFVANDSNDYKFTSKKRDTETGLDYFGARYYSNALGRWVSPDWSAKPSAIPYAVLDDPQSLNLFTYVRNIPTTGMDPDGHCDSTFCNIAAGAWKGLGSFTCNATPGCSSIRDILQNVHDMRHPQEAQARVIAQRHAMTLVAKTAFGGPTTAVKANVELVNMVSTAWKGMSTIDKTAVITEVGLNLGLGIVAGKLPAPVSEFAPAPAMSAMSEGGTSTSLVRLYGPFYRLDPNAEAIAESRTLLGTPARNIYAADSASVKAYAGELPPGRNGIEFFTTRPPDSVGAGTPGSQVWWFGPANSDVTSIPITPCKVVPPGSD